MADTPWWWGVVERHPTQRPGGAFPGGRRAGLAGLLALVGLGAWWWRPRRVEVEGASMLPALQPGDRLIVVRARRGVGVGDVVAARDPRRPERVLVKRVAAREAGGFSLIGDNAAASTDSRQFGPVPAAAVVGRVVYRYAPAGRAGRLYP